MSSLSASSFSLLSPFHLSIARGRYDEWADMRSWEAAGEFVLEAIGMKPYESAEPDAITTTPVDYMDGMTALTGHLAMPAAGWKRPLPAVIILPDWDGANEYEQKRATALAELGYVAMVADMYGSDKQYVEAFEDRVAEISKFAADPTMFVTRVQAAIDQIKMLGDDVDMDEIAIIGYCFGGTVSLSKLSKMYERPTCLIHLALGTYRELSTTAC